MKNILWSMCIVSFTHIGATQNIISFLSQSKPIKLSSFMDLVELQEMARDEFSGYYNNVIDNLRYMRSEKKDIQLQKLVQHGMNNLEIKHPRWAREISDVLTKDNPLYSNAHTFIIRYASLESYFEQKAREKNSILAKVRGFFNQAKETVASWTVSLRPKRKVV